jgi:hypothetical protein
MSSWTDITAIGSGTVDYRLMVEGWPHEWVTTPRITHGDNANGRVVYPGLSYKGLGFSEQSILRDAWPQCSGMNFTIVPTDSNEDTLNSFTRDARPSGYLIDNIVVDDTTWTTRPATFPSGIYHLATEAVFCDGANNITRGYWDTMAQIHTPVDVENNVVPLYNWPPSMEGRRCYLFGYGPSDDPAGDGSIIWRGVITRPPRMAGDGVSWQLQAQSITSLFDQKVGAGDSVSWHIRGVYHHSRVPMTVWFRSELQAYPDEPPYVTRITGFYESNSEWAAYVNAQLSAAIAAEAASSLTDLGYSINGGHPTFLGSTGDEEFFGVAMKDALDGDTVPGSPVVDANGPAKNGENISGRFYVTCGDTAGNFVINDCFYPPFWEYPLPQARALLGDPQLAPIGPPDPALAVAAQFAGLSGLYPTILYQDPDDTTWPSNRLYLQSVDGLDTGSQLMVRNPSDEDEPPVMTVVEVDTPNKFILIDTSHMGALYLSDESTMVRVVRYGDGNNNWADFMQEVVDRAPEANLGLTPYITDNDVNVAAWPAIWETYPFHDYWRYRTYRFVKPVSVKEVLQPEFRVTGWMGRLEADGRFGVCQMPFVSSTRTAQHTLTDDDLLLPAEGMFGRFPTWEAQKDGLINIVFLQLGYSPLTDETNPLFDYMLRMTQSISEHKSGEQAKQDIVPKSTPSGSYSLKKRLERTPSAQELSNMILPYLQTLSKDYAVVTVDVPFTKFDVLCGDIVEVTSAYIPNGLGGRGVAAKKAICIGRQWDLDPANNRMGTLTLWFPRDGGANAGYSPTGRITANSNTSGDTWVLTMSHLNSLNIAWSESSDGNVAKHFGVDDAIAVYEVDQTSPVVVYGQIDSVNTASDQVTVTFNETWTPGGSTWNLRSERSEATLYTDHQMQYAYVADTDGFLPDATSGRSFV